MNKRNSPQFTNEGFEKIKKEYADFQEKRKEAVTQLAFARSQGDLSENSAYKAARHKLSSVDSRLRYLSNLLRFGEVVEPPPSGIVGIGSIVKIHDGSQEKIFTIVGGHESDINEGKISCFSPIGKALMHKKAGTQILITIPAGTLTYTLLSVSP